MYVSKNSCADKSDDEENEVGNARRARDHDNAGRAEGDAATAGDARARLTPCPAGHRCRHASHACAQSRPHPSATKIVPYDAEDMRRPSWSNSGLFCLFIALSSDFPVWRQTTTGTRCCGWTSTGRTSSTSSTTTRWAERQACEILPDAMCMLRRRHLTVARAGRMTRPPPCAGADHATAARGGQGKCPEDEPLALLRPLWRRKEDAHHGSPP
jgi:hypothetical protein